MKSYIVTNRFLDKYNNHKLIEAGETHTPNSEERAKLLLELGFLGEEIEGDDANSDDDGLEKLGGGFYGLPNGEKVRGKAKALESLKALRGGEGDESSQIGSKDNHPEQRGSHKQ